MQEKVFYKSKTFWVGIITIIIGVLEGIAANLDAGIKLTILGILMIICRVVTKTPLVTTATKVAEVSEVKAKRTKHIYR